MRWEMDMRVVDDILEGGGVVMRIGPVKWGGRWM